MAGRKRREDVRPVEPVSLAGLDLGEVLLGLMETGEGQPGPAPAASAAVEEDPVLRLRMPDGQVEREPLLGGFWRRDKEGGLTSPRVATRRDGKALACRLAAGGSGAACWRACREEFGPLPASWRKSLISKGL